MISKYPRITGNSKLNDRTRELQRAVQSFRPVAGPGIRIRETAGGTVISADDSTKKSGGAATAIVWL
jgi:hypothetical protein